MRLHILKEELKDLFDVDKSILNQLILQPRWQLIVEWFNHEGFVARLSLLHFDCIHEVIPSIWVKPLSSLIKLHKALLALRVKDVFHRAVNLIDKHFSLNLLTFKDLLYPSIKLEREESLFNQSECEYGQELNARDQHHAIEGLVSDVISLCCFEIAVTYSCHRCRHEVQLIDVDIKR